eukprot:6452554-Pyramimonas_sp.AAC.1
MLRTDIHLHVAVAPGAHPGARRPCCTHGRAYHPAASVRVPQRGPGGCVGPVHAGGHTASGAGAEEGCALPG